MKSIYEDDLPSSQPHPIASVSGPGSDQSSPSISPHDPGPRGQDSKWVNDPPGDQRIVTPIILNLQHGVISVRSKHHLQKVGMADDVQNLYVYLAELGLEGHGSTAFRYLLHHLLYSAAEMVRMCEIVSDAVLNRVRVRRRELAQAQTHLPSGRDEQVAMNRKHFEGDAEFAEGVFVDKFNFRTFRFSQHGQISVTPTIQII